MPQVFVGIGSNIQREANIRAGVAALSEQFGELQLSSVYESEAMGFTGAPFYNLVASFVTDQSPAHLIGILNSIEDRHGRVRGGERFSARTLDIDLLLYGQLVERAEGYHVPRDEITRYAFVLQPLAELAPELKHPQTGETFAIMWANFDKSGQGLEAISFTW